MKTLMTTFPSAASKCLAFVRDDRRVGEVVLNLALMEFILRYLHDRLRLSPNTTNLLHLFGRDLRHCDQA